MTSPARTILDLCGICHPQAEAAIDAALRLEAVSFNDLARVLELGARHRIPGTILLRKLMRVRGEEEAMSESELESLVVRVLRRGGLSLPQRQVTVEWEQCYRLDFLYPEHDLIVEVDGRKWHASRERFRDDRRRDNAALLAGKRVIRFTWEDVRNDETYVVGTVARALGIQTLFAL